MCMHKNEKSRKYSLHENATQSKNFESIQWTTNLCGY